MKIPLIDCDFQVPGVVQDILYMTAIFNSCINPLIYGVYYYQESRSKCENANSHRFVSLSTYSLLFVNKLELSWAKLSLAGAMVFGLGIVEF